MNAVLDIPMWGYRRSLDHRNRTIDDVPRIELVVKEPRVRAAVES